MRLCLRTFFNFPKNSAAFPPPKFNIDPEKRWFGRWVSFWGPAYFQVQCRAAGVSYSLFGLAGPCASGWYHWSCFWPREHSKSQVGGVGALHGRVVWKNSSWWVEASDFRGCLFSHEICIWSWYVSPPYWLVYIFGRRVGDAFDGYTAQR